MENEILNNLKYKKVLIGDIFLYLCKMNFSVMNEYSETPSVSGGICVTNNAVKSAKITLDAKIIIDDKAQFAKDTWFPEEAEVRIYYYVRV